MLRGDMATCRCEIRNNNVYDDVVDDDKDDDDLHLTGLSKFAPSTVIDLVLLIGRYHIYSRKLAGTSPSMTLFKGKLNSVIEMEKQEALRCNSFTVFSNKWKFVLI